MLDHGPRLPDPLPPTARSGDGDGAIDRDHGAAARGAALRAELQSWMDEVTAQVAASTGEALQRFAAGLADVEERVLEAIGDLRKQFAAGRSRVEARKGGKSAGAGVASRVDELERRVDGLEATIRTEFADALFDRAEQAFERRFDALVQLVDARLSRLAAALPAEERSRRNRLLRRA